MNLALIGYRGAGKTTVARLLAELLAWEWIDADVEIERRAGTTIKEIFKTGGEAVFRDLEQQVVSDLTARTALVIALGGGAILRAENRAAIRLGCKTAWLTATPTAIWKRIAADASTAERRPNLTAGGGLAEIEALLKVRAPLYQECADCTVTTDDRTPQSIAAEILEHLRPALGVTK